MNDKTKNCIYFGGFIIAIILFVVLLSRGTQGGGRVEQNNSETKTEEGLELTNAEKIEVIHFHATQQCWACVTLGDYALKAIEQDFAEEYEEGIITFQNINVDSAENKEIVSKFQARGSSLYINAIVNGQDNIEEDVVVWRLLQSEEKFIEHLSDKLSSMLEE